MEPLAGTLHFVILLGAPPSGPYLSDHDPRPHCSAKGVQAWAPVLVVFVVTLLSSFT